MYGVSVVYYVTKKKMYIYRYIRCVLIYIVPGLPVSTVCINGDATFFMCENSMELLLRKICHLHSIGRC